MDRLAFRSGHRNSTHPLRLSIRARIEVRARDAQPSSPVLLVRALGSRSRSDLAAPSSRRSAVLGPHGTARDPDADRRAAAGALAPHGSAALGHAAPMAT